MGKLCRRGFKCFHFLPTRTSHTTGPSRFRATSHYKKCYSAGKLMWQRARDIRSSTAGRRERWKLNSMTSVMKKKRHWTHALAKIILQLIISVLFHLFTSKMCIQRFVQFDRSTISDFCGSCLKQSPLQDAYASVMLQKRRGGIPLPNSSLQEGGTRHCTEPCAWEKTSPLTDNNNNNNIQSFTSEILNRFR